MTWSRFEPGFTRHPKRVKGGPIASWLWVCSVDHCTEYTTDGVLGHAHVAALIPGLSRYRLKAAIAALLAVGSWEEIPMGYRVHGYLEYHPSREQRQADRAAQRHRVAIWRARRNGVSNALPTPLVTRSQRRTKRVTNGVTPHLDLRLQNLSLKAFESEFKNLSLESDSKTDSKTKPFVRLASDALCLEVLEFLNRKTERHYRLGPANRKFIAGRLKDGATVAQCKAVISKRAAKWKGDPKMDEYLRPKTLFGRENFEQYLGELSPSPDGA